VEHEARNAAFSWDSQTIASAVAEKVIKVLQASSNIKEKDLGRNPTLGLILMVLRGHHLSFQLGYPRLRFIACLREPLPNERVLGQRILLKILQEQDSISLSFIQNESTKDSRARPSGSTTWP
jgi:hypothetical protein